MKISFLCPPVFNRTHILLPISMVPNLLGTRDWFHGRQFFCGWQGRGYGFELNQAYYVYCALYFYLSLFVLSLFLLLLYQFYLRSTGIRSQSLETPAINYNTGLSVQRVVILCPHFLAHNPERYTKL